MEERLHASPSQISLSISLFILLQGNAPLIWSAISEIKGRKVAVHTIRTLRTLIRVWLGQTVYLVSISIFTIGSIIVATAKTIGLVIGFRIIQGAGYVLISQR